MKFRYFFCWLNLLIIFCTSCYSMESHCKITLSGIQLEKSELISKLELLCSKKYSDNYNLIFVFENDDNFKQALYNYNETFGFNSPKATSKPKNLYPGFDKNLTLSKNFNDAAGQQAYKNFVNFDPTEPTLSERISKKYKKGE